MAMVPVIINNAMIVDYYDRVIGGPYKIVGNMGRADVGVGGGPIVPPDKPPTQPPGIWPGPGDPDWPGGAPHPEHPIVLPKPPQVPPPTVWPPGPGIDMPEHPIVLPPPGKPIEPGTIIDWKAVWTPGQGWMVIGVPNVPHPAPSSAPPPAA